MKRKTKLKLTHVILPAFIALLAISGIISTLKSNDRIPGSNLGNGDEFSGIGDVSSSQSPEGWWGGDNDWQYRVKYRITSNTTFSDVPVILEVNFSKLLENIGVTGTFVPESLRVLEIQGSQQNEIPYELVLLPNYNYSVEWTINGSVGINNPRDFFLYFNNTGSFTGPNYYFNETYIDNSSWNKVVYYDTDYGRWRWFQGSSVTNPGTALDYKNYFNDRGFLTVNATEIKSWMDEKIKHGAVGSVVVFAKDSVPATIAENMTENCTLRKYLDAGGRIIHVGYVHLYRIGLPGNTEQYWGNNGGRYTIGVRGLYNTNRNNVSITASGTEWGHVTKDWDDGFSSGRHPVRLNEVTLSFANLSDQYENTTSVAWLKNHNATYKTSGFIRMFPRRYLPGDNTTITSDIYNVTMKYLSPLNESNIERVETEQYFVDLTVFVHDEDGLILEGFCKYHGKRLGWFDIC